MLLMLDFYKNKKVFITGHTGFKGTWLCHTLLLAGAEVTGYALEPGTTPNLFTQTDTARHIKSIIGDVRDRPSLVKAVEASRPDIIFHLAAQPLVRLSYQEQARGINPSLGITCVYQDRDGILNIEKIYQDHPQAGSYFISGPPTMIRTFKQYLLGQGVPPDKVKTDDWE